MRRREASPRAHGYSIAVRIDTVLRMGVLHYGQERFEFEDRLLAHLQMVMTVKLRRGEPFFLGWTSDVQAGSGRHAVWIAAGVPIHIQYGGNRVPTINRDWIETLINAANSSLGLVISPEGHVAHTEQA